jgi:hypothetical protein
MIQRSQRNKASRASEPRPTTLNLHERLASQRLWFLRLMTASTVALALSFVLWLVRVPLEYHLVGIALGFLAGLFARRPMRSWALGWIRERSGLSYETALEQRARADDFGFSETLQQRATQEVSRLAPPKYQVWWLPMLAVALGLAFLPLIPSVANLPSPFNSQAPLTPTTTATNEPNPSAPTQQPVTQAANEPNTANSSASPSPSTGETNASELNNQGSPGESSASQNNRSADEQALGQFLDNLKQNEPPPSDSPDADLSSVMPQSQGNQASNEDNASRPRSEQTNPFARPGEQQQEGQPNANQDSEQGQGEEQGQGQQDQGQQGDQQEQSQEAQSETGQGEEQAQQGAGEQGVGEQGVGEQGVGEQGVGEQGVAGEGEQNQQGSGQSASAEGEGSDQGSDTGQNAEGAGSSPGTTTGQTQDVVGSSQQNPEFLEGSMNEGPNNTAGTVRLPGETNQTVFPEGSSPGSFSRAEEEALTEGRIPLEYQEVIRNYFRSGQ